MVGWSKSSLVKFSYLESTIMDQIFGFKNKISRYEKERKKQMKFNETN